MFGRVVRTRPIPSEDDVVRFALVLAVAEDAGADAVARVFDDELDEFVGEVRLESLGSYERHNAAVLVS